MRVSVRFCYCWGVGSGVFDWKDRETKREEEMKRVR